ncbi:MAG: HDIG domain-containing protein [Oscillospiraceae bacterium]
MLKALGSRYSITNNEKTAEFYGFISDLLDSDIVNEMRNFRHHYSTTCFQHCLNVAYYNYLIARKLKLNSKSAARGGLLHDLYLYDWRDVEKQKGDKVHVSRHPKIALANARESFDLSLREEDIIVKHMWPMTIRPPKYAETYIIVLVDKCSAALEFSSHIAAKIRKTLRKSA